MNELEFYDGSDDESSRGFRRIQATEDVHPYTANWWPAGHGLGYADLFTNQVADFVTAIASGSAPEPGFASALDVQRVLHAVATSADDDSRWTAVDRSRLR